MRRLDAFRDRRSRFRGDTGPGLGRTGRLIGRLAVDGRRAATGAAATPGDLATTGRIEVADKGFALTLPDGWTRVDVTAGGARGRHGRQ